MKLWSDSFADGATIPGEFAFCVIDLKNHVAVASNRNPHLAWSELPQGTQSLALICHDPDAPSLPDDVNKEDREIAADLPRADFFHWTLFNISPAITEIAAGSHSHSVVAHGKGGPVTHQQMRHGLNDYTSWFAGDHDMDGDYFGYDGPCPPWNDARVHRYIFTLYALDVEQLSVEDKSTGPQILAALAGHILDKAQIHGIYTLNPRLA